MYVVIVVVFKYQNQPINQSIVLIVSVLCALSFVNRVKKDRLQRDRGGMTTTSLAVFVFLFIYSVCVFVFVLI